MPLILNDNSTLNDLISTTFDSVNSYVEAGKNSESYRFVASFHERTVERRAVVTALRSELMRLGGEPADDGALLARERRMFLNLKSVVADRDEEAIIEEVGKGEDRLKTEFEDAMGDTDLSLEVMHTIRECYASIMQGYDQMLILKHSTGSSRAHQV